MMVSLAYGELVKLSPVVAHKKIIDCYFYEAGRKVARVARRLGISRPTVLKWLRRFFQEGEAGLDNHPSRPKTSPNKTPQKTEQLVLEVFQKTNWGSRRIAKILKRKYGIKISYATVGNILKRRKCFKPRIKITIRRTGRRYYNPLDFKPFEFIQIDIKEVVDGDTLPAEVYVHFLDLRRRNVPLYQFTAVDIRTRLRFIAYGQQKSFANGWAFIILVVLWLRAFGVRGRIVIQTDWGDEWGGDDGKKLAWMNQLLASWDAEITRIHKGRKEENGYVERSHRTDDEEFYIPYGLEVKDTESLFLMAYSWIGYYNTRRAHTGENLDGKTPIEYAKEVMPELNRDIALFPPVILDNLTTSSYWKSVNKVPTHYIRLKSFMEFLMI